ncbi:MAG: GumC family protein [Vicinamibacterales bacterium]
MSDELPLPDPPASSPAERPRSISDGGLPPAPEFTGGHDARRSGYGYGYAGAPATVRSGGDGVHLMDYVRVLYKRRWIAILAFVLVFGAVSVHTFTAIPLYRSAAQVLIENEDANVVAFQPVVEENRLSPDYYQTQYRILESRALARRAIDHEQLWEAPYFNPAPGSDGLTTRVLRWAQGLVDRNGTPAPPEPGAGETVDQARVIDRYLASLRIEPVRNSRIVEVAFVTTDPAFSARLANAHAAAYIDQNLEHKYLASKEAADWLSDRMSEQREHVEEAEQKLQAYREQTGAVSLEDRQNIVVQRLTELTSAVTRARTERIEKEAVYNQVRNLSADKAALDTVPAVLNNVFIQQQRTELAQLQQQRAQLAEKLGERHPDMVKNATAIAAVQRRIDGEIQKVVQALRNDYQAALANERSLQSALEQQRGEAQDLNRASIQYGALQRDAQANRQLFEGLLQRTRETDISSDLRTNNIRVVDAAEPPRAPSSPNRRNNLALGLLGGLFLGVGLAFFSEYLDGRIKSPEEIKEQLRMPCLGLLPAITLRPGEHDPLVSSEVPASFAEAIKSLRTNLLFSSAEDASKTLVVTSTGPGEGKTVVAGNLAISLAQAGQRVLLMDCDMRRPRVHTLCGCPSEPGLSNVMVGDAKASDAVRKSGTPNLWVLPAGKHPPNPAELLGSKRFRDFMRGLAGHFDWIVLDTPPVMAVTDAVVVAHHAHGVVYVVGAEMTHRSSARHAVEMLEGGKAHFYGAVLNRVALDKNPYYYSPYYRKEYARYYGSSEVA